MLHVETTGQGPLWLAGLSVSPWARGWRESCQRLGDHWERAPRRAGSGPPAGRAAAPPARNVTAAAGTTRVGGARPSDHRGARASPSAVVGRLPRYIRCPSRRHRRGAVTRSRYVFDSC